MPPVLLQLELESSSVAPGSALKQIAAKADANGYLKVSLGSLIEGENQTFHVMETADTANYTNLSASALVKTGAGYVYGVIVNSNTAGTLKLWDNTSAATTVLVNTYTFAAGSSNIVFPAALKFNTGLYATIGGTADITIAWK